MVEKRRSSNRDDDHDSVWVRSTRRRKRSRFLLPSPEIKSRSNEGKTYIYIYRHMLYPYAELDMPTRYEANALGRSMPWRSSCTAARWQMAEKGLNGRKIAKLPCQLLAVSRNVLSINRVLEPLCWKNRLEEI